MRIMLDTNVLISVVMFDSKKLKNMLLNICDKHTLVLSACIIQELKEVTERKFPSKRKSLIEFLSKLPYELEYEPLIIVDKEIIKVRDSKDIPVLYSAITSKVDILITGDKDFEDITIEKPEIITPSEFLEKYL